ncbi:MAG: sulfatase-like hydrolase/transferase [bacterium]|nr:sulfatase-like hydrolase/transferase [bacterium]
MAHPHWLLPLSLSACFFGATLLGVDSHYSATAAGVFGGLYLLLGFTLHFLLLASRHLGAAPGFGGALTVALVLVWHCRELTYRPASLVAVPAVAALIALPVYWLAGRSYRQLSRRRALSGLTATAVVLGGSLVLVAETSELLRWHLLRHNKMLGTPVYYALEPGVKALESELFAAHRQGGDGIAATAGQEPDQRLPSSAAGEKPHVVFLLLDTLRSDALEMGGGPRRWMPELNAYLERSYRFTDVVANASWTRPTMASFFTGLLPEEHGARDVDDPLEESYRTLPEMLRGLGYETAAFVSNVGAVGRGAGFAQGFDFFREFGASPYARAEEIRRTVEEWLEHRGPEAPSLFLYLHFLDPHEPYLSGRTPAHKSRAEYQAAYQAELAYLDRELSEFLGALGTRLPGPTILFVASDHGEEFGEHEEFGHGYSLYREVIRIPVALRTGDEGGEISEPLEGRDFFDLLIRYAAAGGSLSVREWAELHRRSSRYYSVYYSSEGRLLLRPYLRRVCMRAVERGGYKLVWSAYGSTFELYDLERDPGERNNLAAAHPQLVEDLAADFDAGVSRWSFPQGYERSPEELEQLRALGYLE